MAEKQKSGKKNRKSGRNRNSPSMKRYNAEFRARTNKIKRVMREWKESIRRKWRALNQDREIDYNKQAEKWLIDVGNVSPKRLEQIEHEMR